ncbi:MAG: ATP-binding protein [Pseudomonadota bacterium]
MQDDPCSIDLTVEPRFERIGDAVETIIAGLATACSAPSGNAGAGSVPPLEELRLAIAEAINNVLEHAGHPADQPLRLRTGRQGRTVWVEIRDLGLPLPDTVLCPRDPGEVFGAVIDQMAASSDGTCSTDATPEIPNVETLPEGGWGWALIHVSVDRIDYRRDGAENLLRLEKDLP